jgi:3-deoxy-D-manno-octulosonic-acid transferase/heptosyltransferase-1
MIRRGPKILIVKLSAIGDVVHTLPALNALRRHYPEAHMTWLVEEAAADLVVGHPALDRVLISRRKHWLRGMRSRHWRRNLAQIGDFLRTLRAERYDMVFDFQAAIKGAALVALARARRKIGFGPGLEHQEHSYLVLNERIPAVSMDIHALVRGLKLLEAVGIPCDAVEYRLPIGDRDRRRAGRLRQEANGIAADRPSIAINPMAKWETKLWPSDRFAQLADRLSTRYGAALFFTGGSADHKVIERIRKNMRSAAANLAGRTNLMELAALYERMDCVISTDTGPMHIAAAVGAPTVALFGPTADWRTGPFCDGHRIVSSDPQCRPCFKRTCRIITMDCMRGIGVEQVLDLVDDVLADKGKAP